jgi:hypothetical protein
VNIIPVTLLLLAATPDRLDLAGRVTASEGAAVKGAHVLIYTARVRKGTNALCPSCYADCAKRVETGSDGSFTIRSLDPELIFRVLVVAEGYRPSFAESVDPAKGPITVALTSFDSNRLDPSRVVRGIVLDPEGQPVVGAIVSPESFKTEEWSGFKPGVFDPLAVTNLQGEFALTARSPIEEVRLKVEGRGLAPRLFPERAPSKVPHRLKLTRGATVSGRLVRNGKPVSDALVGLVQVNRGMGSFLGPMEIGTDREGRFTFLNVASDEDYYVYGHMSSLKDHGAVPARAVRVGTDGTTVVFGDLLVVAGHTISGRVLLSDGKPTPPNTRILASREMAWDSQAAVLDADGRFTMKGLPTERYSLNVIVKGYHISSKNHSIDSNNPYRLLGTVDQDITGLKILLELGDR